jgi:outer membrane lipoprotein carrier protein
MSSIVAQVQTHGKAELSKSAEAPVYASTTLNVHRKPDVNTHVKRLLVLLCLTVGGCLGAGVDTSALLKEVQARYNNAKTLQVLFEQTFTQQNRPRRTEAGELCLRKPGRMRWEYSSPKGKLFVSDGKKLYLYTPSSNRVSVEKMKESEDLRAPLGFLLGRLDFWRDFGKFTYRAEGEDVRIVADPKSDRAAFTQVEFVVTPSRQIRYVKVVGQDRSIMEFRFSSEKLNPTLSESLFRFEIPPGAEVVDAMSGPEEGQ